MQGLCQVGEAAQDPRVADDTRTSAALQQRVAVASSHLRSMPSSPLNNRLRA